MAAPSVLDLPAFKGKFIVNAVVETPQNSRNKFTFNPDTGLFELEFAMPAGTAFPFEFGFVPSTLAEDGDPLDVLLLLDAPTFSGCLVEARLVGVIEAKQSNPKGRSIRNDRLIAVAAVSHRHEKVHNLEDLPSELLNEIEHFFAAYNEVRGRKFKVLALRGPKRARNLVKIAARNYD